MSEEERAELHAWLVELSLSQMQMLCAGFSEVPGSTVPEGVSSEVCATSPMAVVTLLRSRATKSTLSDTRISEKCPTNGRWRTRVFGRVQIRGSRRTIVFGWSCESANNRTQLFDHDGENARR
jgi:hypothetical protein